jgi:tRNA threonylcarbamoyladenosine biosynthesis protein TsaB
MLILGVDTSGKNGSLALVQFEGDRAHTLALVPLEGGTFSAQLVPQISALLIRHNLTTRHIDAFAVVSGPGSFTGLRVGLAAIKALAEILKKPIAAVTLLEAIASEVLVAARAVSDSLKVSARCLVVMDARRNEVFMGEYEIGGEIPILVGETLRSLEELVHLAEEIGRNASILTPDVHLVDSVRARMRDPFLCNLVRVEPPDPSAIARLGWKKIAAGKTISPEALDAAYIRRSDAEIMRSKRVPK